MEKSWRNFWIRWILVFLLISLGFSLTLGGLDQAVRDRDPIMAFVGYWIAQAIFVVVPGVIIGGIISLATSKPVLGGKFMIAVNAVITAMVVAGAVLQAQE